MNLKPLTLLFAAGLSTLGGADWPMPASRAAAETSATASLSALSSDDLRKLFDRRDAEFHASRAGAEADNSKGGLAWSESYLMQGWMQMYRATGDRVYLRKLAARFDEILALRDDKLGLKDDYTSTALAGWGTSSYNRGGAKWHVFIVHTGMIALAPAEFARAVKADPALQAEFGTSASAYLTAIYECIHDTEQYWRDGPADDEGYYVDPALGIAPLNHFNALGSTLIEMHAATGDVRFRDRAARLARFFKNRIHLEGDRSWWAYRPKADRTEDRPEDISHASVNVGFAVRCCKAGIVFDSGDLNRMARTWTEKVDRADGTWAADVAGKGDGGKYLPGSAGRWLPLAEGMDDAALRKRLIDSVTRAYGQFDAKYASHILGYAHLLRIREADRRK